MQEGGEGPEQGGAVCVREREEGERVTGEVEPVAAAETLAGRELLARHGAPRRRGDPRAEDEGEREMRGRKMRG